MRCKTCSKAFPRKSAHIPGPPRRFCSDVCRKAHLKTYQHQWRQRNKAKVNARRDAIREQVREWDRAFYAKNRERRKAFRREWYRQHTEQELAAARVYRENNPSIVRAIGRKNRATRRARLKALFVEPIDPRIVFEQAHGICGICGAAILDDDWHVDHIVPLVKGGRHAYDNVQPAHARCNRAKGARVDASGRRHRTESLRA